MLTCPKCNSTLAILELNDIEIDYCFSCGGIWLDKGELELLYEIRNQEVYNKFAEISETDIKEKKRRCPICRKKMKKVAAKSGECEVILDKCKSGDGIWFDNGELLSLLENKCSEDNKVICFLKDMFKQQVRGK